MRYFFPLMLLSILSCRQKVVELRGFVSVWPKNIDTSYLKKQRKQFLNNLNINDISLGVDSFEIRLARNHALFVEKDLFVIIFLNNKWTAIHYAFQGDLDDSISFQKREFLPINPVKSLIDSIYLSGILDIPSQVDLKDYRNRVADGEYFVMEFATKDKFKLILYENPYHYPEYAESKIVSNFIEMFYRNIPHEEICWPRCAD